MGANGVTHTMVEEKPVLTAEAFLVKFGLDARAVSGGMAFKREIGRAHV